MPVFKETVMHKEKECDSKENPVSKEAVRETVEHKVEEAFKQLNAFVKECRLNNIPLNSGESCDTEELVEELFS